MEALAEAYRELARYDDAEALHREALAHQAPGRRLAVVDPPSR